ncbi:MAG: hypothetical protein NXI09_11900 [Bacteroidetes bacterium]|nr:hypothetical protein [Bacteroidota bacterium]
MTKRDFFILLLKIFGLYSLIASLFSALPGQLSFLIQSLDPISLIIMTVSIVIVLGLFALLIFKADKVVNLLKLDRGFDEERIELGKIDSDQIIKIGTFVIGGFLLLDHLPTFLSQTIFAFKASQIGLDHNDQDKTIWLANGVNIIIGYLLLTNYDFVAKGLKTKKK